MMMGSNLLDFDVYQHEATKTLKNGNSSHLSFGLLAEAGEVATLFQKFHRGDPRYVQPDLFGDDFSHEFRNNLYKEMGDVLWYLACLADYFGMPLSSVAQYNLDKLKKRQAEGKIQGDGDNR